MDYTFMGQIGIDDENDSRPRMLLKYGILEDETESEPQSGMLTSYFINYSYWVPAH